MTAPHNTPRADWEKIHADFRAGKLSVCEIARQHGISDAAIRKRAKAQGWVRDLGDRVRQETRAKLAREDAKPVGSGFGSGSGSGFSREDEARTIEIAADRGVAVVREHRAILRRGFDLADRMLNELEAVTTKRDELVALIEEATKDDKSPQRRNAMLKAVEVPGRIAALKDLSMSLKNLIPLDRQAFNLDEAKTAEDSLGALIAASFTRLPDVTPSELEIAPGE